MEQNETYASFEVCMTVWNMSQAMVT